MSFFKCEYAEKLEEETILEHLRAFVSEKKIEKYNASLPSNDAVDKYNEQVESYWRVKETLQKFDIDIANVGSLKANEIFVSIEFPEQLRAMKKSDAEGLQLPKNPFPENPVRNAEIKYKQEERRRACGGRGIFSGDFDTRIHTLPSNPVYALRDDVVEKLSELRREVVTELSENEIRIKMESLRHGTTLVTDNFGLIPLDIGEFEAKVSIICEEDREMIVTTFPISVREEPAQF